MPAMQLYLYVRAFHIFGVLAWIGALIGLSFILMQHAKSAEGARADFIELEKGTAMAMDIFAMIAIACGAYLIISHPEIMKSGGWIHAKLTLVLVILGLHGFQRARVAKYKRGEVKPNPAWIIPAIELAAFAVVILAAARPF
jgi:putative membrane protein